jgi:hypothetical protein
LSNAQSYSQSLITEYQALGPYLFWEKYSVNTRNLPITSILKQMKKARLDHNSRAVTEAKQRYGDKFDEIFSYRKRLELQVLVRPDAIAKRLYLMDTAENGQLE